MTPLQCKMARTALGWGVIDLAREAHVSTQTIVRFERGDQLKSQTVDNLQNTMEEAGVEFIPENGGGVGVRLSRRSEST
jgi:transcriptional regulator with XRE-family HTH domain